MLNGELPFLWAIASAMAVLTAWLVKKGSRMETLYDASVVLFLLVMMASMFVSSVAYLYQPTLTAFFVLFIYNMIAMSIAFIPLGYALVFGNKRIEQIGEEFGFPVRAVVEWAAVGLVIASEVFMGWTFAILGGSVQTVGGVASIFSALVSSTASYWFIFTMAGEMAITLLFLRKDLPRGVWWMIGAQVAVMFLSPTAIADAGWARYSTYVGSAVMILFFIFVFEFLYKNMTPNVGTMNYLVRIMFAYALMMAGVFIWLMNGDASLFVLSLLVEMGVYFYTILGPRRLDTAEGRAWQSRPDSVFAVLAFLFVAGFFMGVAIDVFSGVSYFTSLPLALAMAVFIAWLVKKGSRMETLYDGSVLLFFLVMMALMFVSSVAYLYHPGLTDFFVLFIYNMIAMGVAFIPLGYTLRFGNKRMEQVGAESGFPMKVAVEWAAVGLIIVSEVFMGWTFAILGGSVQTFGGVYAAFSAPVSSTASYWFIFTMAGEMAITLLALRKALPKQACWIIGAQTAIMFLSPTAIADAGWARYSTYVGSAVMILLFIYAFEFLYRNRTLSTATMSYLVRLMFAYALMMAGLFIWLMNGDASLFVLSLLVEMGVYFYVVLRPERLDSAEKRAWQSRPYWVLGLLGFLFVAEFFMGGVLDIYAYGVSYFTTLPLVSVGASLLAVPAAFYNFIVFFSSVTASVWYLIMMGIEMGALVLFKMGRAREVETKVRLGMVMVSYAIYAIYLPSFVIPNYASYVPWVGWSMGLGTAGAVAPSVLVALVASYLISGVLSFLFGSRNVCSVFCTAALMYQGTLYDSMSSFNRTSKLGRKYLTSKFSSIYKVAASLVWVSLIATAVLSYLNSVGVVNVSFFGADVSSFLYSFYFNVLWYILWIMIPFVGTYGCVNTGMCGWGSFNQLISRFGLFKLKVRDSAICVSCKTVDCTKVCPVGITDLPKEFIRTGQLKSMKCIGVGDCVSVCPYENIYFYDVRRWLREKFSKPLPLTQPAPHQSSQSG